jgi:hypothetical protein
MSRVFATVSPLERLLHAGAPCFRAVHWRGQNGSVIDGDIDDFIGLETQVWQALVDGDIEADVRLLSEDFLGVYPSGFAGRNEHAAQLIDGPTVATFQLSEARLVAVSEAAMVLAYRAIFTRPSGTDVSEPEAMYVSSLWCRRDDRWVNLFSHDTPLPLA